jgi:hypothetical protein
MWTWLETAGDIYATAWLLGFIEISFSRVVGHF